MKRKKIIVAIAVIAAIITVVFMIGLMVPLTGSTAISMAQGKEVYERPDLTYGQLVAWYEQAVGVEGVWHANPIDGHRGNQYSWDVTYTHQRLGVLWFGVQSRWTVFMDDVSPDITRQMLEAVEETDAH